MKIGIIGLEDIAQKAYLPVISQLTDFEVHLCTRDQAKLKEKGLRYRFHHLQENIESLLTGVEAEIR